MEDHCSARPLIQHMFDDSLDATLFVIGMLKFGNAPGFRHDDHDYMPDNEPIDVDSDDPLLDQYLTAKTWYPAQFEAQLVAYLTGIGPPKDWIDPGNADNCIRIITPEHPVAHTNDQSLRAMGFLKFMTDYNSLPRGDDTVINVSRRFNGQPTFTNLYVSQIHWQQFPSFTEFKKDEQSTAPCNLHNAVNRVGFTRFFDQCCVSDRLRLSRIG